MPGTTITTGPKKGIGLYTQMTKKQKTKINGSGRTKREPGTTTTPGATRKKLILIITYRGQRPKPMT